MSDQLVVSSDREEAIAGCRKAMEEQGKSLEKQLEFAIHVGGYDWIKDLIDQGADVNCVLDEKRDVPLWANRLLFINMGTDNKSDVWCNDLWELVLVKANVMASSKVFENSCCHHLLSLDSPEAIALVFIKAISETEGRVRLDHESYLERWSEDEEFCHSLKQKISRVHEIVKQRLLNPATPLDRMAVAALHKCEDRDYWHHELKINAPSRPEIVVLDPEHKGWRRGFAQSKRGVGAVICVVD